MGVPAHLSDKGVIVKSLPYPTIMEDKILNSLKNSCRVRTLSRDNILPEEPYVQLSLHTAQAFVAKI